MWDARVWLYPTTVAKKVPAKLGEKEVEEKVRV